MSTKACPHCAQEIPLAALRCRHCKQEVAGPDQIKACPVCKAKLFHEAPSCHVCGNSFAATARDPVTRRRSLETMRAARQARNFEAGAALSATFRIFFANFLPFVVTSAVILSPQIALSILIATDEQFLIEFPKLREHGDTLLAMVLGPTLTGALSYGVFMQLSGRPVALGTSIGVGLSRVASVLALALVAGIVTLVGFMACIVPGIILTAMWYVAVPCAVVEHPGLGGALGRSADLTSGHRGQVLGVAISLGVLSFAVVLAVALPFYSNLPLMQIVMQLVAIPASALAATAGPVVYYQLRAAKENIDVADLASVFD